MKTMNFLCTMVLALFLGSCTTENQAEELSSVDFKGSKSQEKEKNQENEENQEEQVTIYFEWDLHLIALASEIVQIEEEIETSEGNSGSLQIDLERKQTEYERVISEAQETAQRWADSGKMDYYLYGAADDEAVSQGLKDYLGLVQEYGIIDYYLGRRPGRLPGGGGLPCGDVGRCKMTLYNGTTVFVPVKRDISINATRDGEPSGAFGDFNPVEGPDGGLFFKRYEGEEGADRLEVIDGFDDSSYDLPLGH